MNDDPAMILFLALCDLHHHGAFDALFEQLTAIFVNSVDASRCVICIGRTTAGAIKSRPAIAAFCTRISVALSELILCLNVFDPVPNVTKAVFLVADELMTRIQLTPRGDSHIFCTRAASGDALVDARAVFEVEHIMIEGERTAFLFTLDHFFG